MKKTIFIVFLIASLFNSCEIVEDVTTFDINTNTNFNIASNIAPNTVYTIQLNTPIDSITDSFDSNNTHADLVDEIYITQCILNITNPNNGTFEFLDSIAIFVNADGLPEKRIAFSDTLTNTDTISLSLNSETNLNEYLTSTNLSMRLEGLNSQELTEDYQVNLDLSFMVNAELIGY